MTTRSVAGWRSERLDGMRQHRLSGKDKVLFLDLAAHAGAPTGRNDDGGQTGFGAEVMLLCSPSPRYPQCPAGSPSVIERQPSAGLFTGAAAKWPKWLAILPVFGAICPKFQQPPPARRAGTPRGCEARNGSNEMSRTK